MLKHALKETKSGVFSYVGDQITCAFLILVLFVLC